MRQFTPLPEMQYPCLAFSDFAGKTESQKYLRQSEASSSGKGTKHV
jgi:hypothetical protein